MPGQFLWLVMLLVKICFRLIAPWCTSLKTLPAFCMKPKPKTYKIQGFSVTKSDAHVDTERSNSCHVLTKTNATTLSAGYKQMKPRYMYPGCWMLPRVTSLAFGIGTNSKAQHIIAHGQDDQKWQHLLRFVISGYVICGTGSQQRHLLQQQFLDSVEFQTRQFVAAYMKPE